MSAHSALLALEDGSLFWGNTIGVTGTSVGEVVFNTAMTGYQEILTDPSYAKQIITLTYPHIGNTGTNDEDEESARVYASGLVIRDLPVQLSNWRSQGSLQAYLERQNVVAIEGIDTRRLTRILREKGAQNGAIVTALSADNINEPLAVSSAKNFPGLKGMDLAKEVTTDKAYFWKEGCWSLEKGYQVDSSQQKYSVVAYDFGVKRNILRILHSLGCEIEVIPATTPAKEVLNKQPDGVFLSNGPGDPEPCEYAIEALREIIEKGVPTFGICLGHQLLGLACGARTVKMKFGHHGANHPVQDLASGAVMISSQNHGFSVDQASLPDCLQATHRSLFDQSLQGIRHTNKPAYSFQGHPEASPGPQDVKPLFEQFIEMMERYKTARK
ncbi:MAG: glutamine-hydrolyzing carbamoyl-phosphate synthase small subunit [Gammaproteobacteria bacterium]|nr:glutamine-hydrolyzing carbamoyl-phosphate synthase small subunit [Gammaproteobacteria bacterium]